MLKKILVIAVTFVICAAVTLSPSALADSETLKKIDNIIDGNQDYLVLASIGGYDGEYFDVDVQQVIGNFEDTTEEEIKEKHFRNSIYVTGSDSYMYFDNTGDKPKPGDNVLISINHRYGDEYSVENGMFKVDFADKNVFKFEVSENLVDKPEHLELIKLHVFVRTNGSITDIKIKDNTVYYKESGKEKPITTADNVGVKFIDDFGDPANMDTDSYPDISNKNAGNEAEQSKWKLVAVILGSGLLLGLIFVKFTKKFDKRFDK